VFSIKIHKYQIMIIVINGGQRLEGIGVTEAVTAMLRAGYQLYMSGVSSARFSWI